MHGCQLIALQMSLNILIHIPCNRDKTFAISELPRPTYPPTHHHVTQVLILALLYVLGWANQCAMIPKNVINAFRPLHYHVHEHEWFARWPHIKQSLWTKCLMIGELCGKRTQLKSSRLWCTIDANSVVMPLSHIYNSFHTNSMVTCQCYLTNRLSCA